jgi:tetratricopeptide (TPR) repeat protein
MANDLKDDEEDFGDFGDDSTPFQKLRIDQAGPAVDDDPHIQELKAKIAAHPNKAELHAQLARAYVDLGADDEAGVCFDAAIALDPKNASYLHGRGQVALSNSDSHAAHEFLEKALQLDQNNADILYDLGVTARQEDNHNKAKTFFRQATAKDPKHARALFALAGYSEGEEAIELYKQCVAADPSMTPAYFAAGQLLLVRGKQDDSKVAVEYLAKAAAQDPSDPQHFAKLLQAYDTLGMEQEFEKTRGDFKQAFAKGSLNANFLLVGRYSPAQFEVDDKFVMAFDHLKLLGAEPARLVFNVNPKGDLHEDHALFRVSLIVEQNGTFSLQSVDKTTRKHFKDYPSEPSFHSVKADVVAIAQGKLAPTKTTPL